MGDSILINPGGATEEENQIAGFGSLILALPLQFDHEPGEAIIRTSEAPDTDGDGCTDAQEAGPDETRGGRRDPNNFWDFYDPNRDGAVALGDFLAVLARFGSQGDANIDPLSEPPPPPAYHTRFDRGGQTPGGNLWDELPPNGQIGLSDFLSVLGQFGHTCIAS